MALLEDDDLDHLIGDIHPDELDDPNAKVSIRVLGCVDDGRAVYQPPEGVPPQFWTVYKRVFLYADDGREIEALEYAMDDFDSPEEAEAEAARLKEIYRAQGRLIED